MFAVLLFAAVLFVVVLIAVVLFAVCRINAVVLIRRYDLATASSRIPTLNGIHSILGL